MSTRISFSLDDTLSTVIKKTLLPMKYKQKPIQSFLDATP